MPSTELVRRPVGHVAVRAVATPSSAVAAAVGVGIGALDHSVVLAVVLAAVGIVGRVGVAVTRRLFRRPAAETLPDPWAVPEPWRSAVGRGADAYRRLEATVTAWPEGPTRERLTGLLPTARLAAVHIGTLAAQGAALGAAGSADRRRALSDQMTALQRGPARPGAAVLPAGDGDDQSMDDQSMDDEEAAVAGELRAAHHADAVATRTLNGIRTAVATLEELGVAAAELRLGRGGEGDAVGPLPAEGSMRDALSQLQALQAGMAEVTALEDPAGARLPSLPPGPPAKP